MDKDLFVIVGMIDEVSNLTERLNQELNKHASECDIDFDKLYEIAERLEDEASNLLGELED